MGVARTVSERNTITSRMWNHLRETSVFFSLSPVLSILPFVSAQTGILLCCVPLIVITCWWIKRFSTCESNVGIIQFNFGTPPARPVVECQLMQSCSLSVNRLSDVAALSLTRRPQIILLYRRQSVRTLLMTRRFSNWYSASLFIFLVGESSTVTCWSTTGVRWIETVGWANDNNPLNYIQPTALSCVLRIESSS